MEEKKRELLRAFYSICFNRLEIGDEKYGDHYEDLNLIDEITNELADISNYAFMQYVKLLNLKKKIKELEKAN